MTDYAGKETDLNSTDFSLFIVREGGGGERVGRFELCHDKIDLIPH